MAILHNRILSKILKPKVVEHFPQLGDPVKRERIKGKLRLVNRLMLLLLVLPAALFWITIFVGFERTPITGRYACFPRHASPRCYAYLVSLLGGA